MKINHYSVNNFQHKKYYVVYTPDMTKVLTKPFRLSSEAVIYEPKGTLIGITEPLSTGDIETIRYRVARELTKVRLGKLDFSELSKLLKV